MGIGDGVRLPGHPCISRSTLLDQCSHSPAQLVALRSTIVSVPSLLRSDSPVWRTRHLEASKAFQAQKDVDALAEHGIGCSSRQRLSIATVKTSTCSHEQDLALELYHTYQPSRVGRETSISVIDAEFRKHAGSAVCSP